MKTEKCNSFYEGFLYLLLSTLSSLFCSGENMSHSNKILYCTGLIIAVVSGTSMKSMNGQYQHSIRYSRHRGVGVDS